MSIATTLLGADRNGQRGADTARDWSGRRRRGDGVVFSCSDRFGGRAYDGYGPVAPPENTD